MRKLFAPLLVAGLWLSATGPAGAHVTLNPREAPKGGHAAVREVGNAR